MGNTSTARKEQDQVKELSDSVIRIFEGLGFSSRRKRKRLLPSTSIRRANALPMSLGGSHLTKLSNFLKIFSSNILTKIKFSAILYT